MNWHPSLGVWPEAGGMHFRVWAPEAKQVQVVFERTSRQDPVCPLEKTADGYFEGVLDGAADGDLYRYEVDGQGPYPDPVSRFQPHGVHGPSQVVDPREFRWQDAGWKGIPLEKTVLYEMHVGTFTMGGTLHAAQKFLPYLADLGVTAVELMPVADFAGDRNWGYDGVALFAPARCYGEPGDLRSFVNEAHHWGLAVYLDVVYNHLGPDGAYLNVFSPYYFTDRHKTPWGQAVNFDGKHSGPVRDFFIENALYWIHEFHIDGLRLDATHAIADDSARHILAELADRVRCSEPSPKRQAVLVAEDHRNLAHMVKPEADGGWGLDALWSDDFHHQIRRCAAGDRDGYFVDFSGSLQDIATTIRQGWFYCGQYADFFKEERGTDPTGLAPQKFVFFIQNHDQVGNRAFGERLHHQIDLACYRALSVLLLCSPQCPLLFMGQEWAASSAFQYFTDHHEELGKLVTKGRRNEFRRFEAFADPEARKKIPDPQDPQTFRNSHLRWPEAEEEPHLSTLRLYQALLSLRQTETAFEARADFHIAAISDTTLLLTYNASAADVHDESGDVLLAIVHLQDAATISLRETGIWDSLHADSPDASWDLLLNTEDPEYALEPQPLHVDLSPGSPVIQFSRPGAVVLRRRAAGSSERR